MLTTDFGSGYYKLDCPCFHQHTHSNTDSNSAKPGYLWPKGWGSLQTRTTLSLSGVTSQAMLSSDGTYDGLLSSLKNAFAEILGIESSYVEFPTIVSVTLADDTVQASIVINLLSSLSAAAVQRSIGDCKGLISSLLTASVYAGYNETLLRHLDVSLSAVTNEIEYNNLHTDDSYDKAYLLLIVLSGLLIPLSLCYFYVCHRKSPREEGYAGVEISPLHPGDNISEHGESNDIELRGRDSSKVEIVQSPLQPYSNQSSVDEEQNV